MANVAPIYVAGTVLLQQVNDIHFASRIQKCFGFPVGLKTLSVRGFFALPPPTKSTTVMLCILYNIY
jgi:hypothetical protein